MKSYIEFPIHYKPPTQEIFDKAKAYGEVITTTSEGVFVTMSYYEGAFYVLDAGVINDNFS